MSKKQRCRCVTGLFANEALGSLSALIGQKRASGLLCSVSSFRMFSKKAAGLQLFISTKSLVSFDIPADRVSIQLKSED